jgi:tetratricopeptide (TPR) repeat protein
MVLLEDAESICNSAGIPQNSSKIQVDIYRGRIGVAHVARNKSDYFEYAEKEYLAETEKAKHTATATSDLAGAYLHMGIAYNLNSLYDGAISYLEESKRLRESMPGFKRDHLFSPLYQLAHSHFQLGDDKKAAELLEIAIKDRTATFGAHDNFSMR